MNLQEKIRTLLREQSEEKAEIKPPIFFRRRSDVKKVKDLLPYFVNDVFYDSENFEEFKYKLTLIALEYYLSSNHDLSWEDLPEQEEIEFINTLSEVLNDTIKELYNTKI